MAFEAVHYEQVLLQQHGRAVKKHAFGCGGVVANILKFMRCISNKHCNEESLNSVNALLADGEFLETVIKRNSQSEMRPVFLPDPTASKC